MDEPINNDFEEIFTDKDYIKKRKKNYINGSVLILKIIIINLLIIIIKKDKDNKDNKNDTKPPDTNPNSNFKILKRNSDFIKPINNLNLDFELIELNNNSLKVFLISDNYTDYSSFYIDMPYGYGIETLNGLSHLSEHLSFSGNSYIIYDLLYNLKNGILFAYTHLDKIEYHCLFPNDINFEKSLETLHNFLMFPNYDINDIKQEIQSINSEASLKNAYFEVLGNQIITDLANPDTSFHGFGMGNNQTMKVDEVEKIKKLLMGNAKNLYDTNKMIYLLYSNKSIKNLEEMSVKILGKKQRNIDTNEYDINDIEQREKNKKDLINKDIYGDNLYLHGFYLNDQWNTIIIYINIKNFDFEKLKFNPSEYLNYLMFSDSLLNILKNKKYIINNNFFEIKTDITLQNNVLLKLSLKITDDAIKNHLEDVLLIIYKYFKLINQNASKEIFFNNFKKKMEILSNNTQKEYFQKGKNQEILNNLIFNYKYFGIDQFLKFGTPEEYNYANLQNFAEHFSIENTFILIGTKYDDLGEQNVFEKFEQRKIFGFERYYNYSKLSQEFIDKINNDNTYENLKFREINEEYFTNISEKVIPCFKEEKNTCKEKNEFDINKENEYTKTILNEEDKEYIAIYQIDKSSETHLVNIYLNLNIQPYEKKHPLSSIIYSLIMNIYNYKFKDINEIKNTIQIINMNDNLLSLKIQTYSDICESVFKKIIDILNKNITSEELDFAKVSYVNNINSQLILPFSNIVLFKFFQFYNKGKDMTPSFNDIILNIINLDNVTDIQEYHRNILKSTLIVAGNINKVLVNNLNNYLKKSFEIQDNKNKILYNLNSNKIINNNLDFSNDNKSLYIYNYFERIECKNDIDGMTVITYLYDSKNIKLKNYLEYFTQCAKSIFFYYFKNKYMDSTGPYINMNPSSIYLDSDSILIILQGRMVEADTFDEHLQILLKEIFDGKIKCPNFESVKKTILFKESENIEKTPNNLFDIFVNKILNNNEIKSINDNENIPESFEEVIDEVKEIFINPKRFAIYGYRKDIKIDEINERINLKNINNKYFLNENYTMIYTNNISYLIDK